MVAEQHDALRELASGELSEEQRAQVAAHFLECEECRRKARAVGLYPGGHLTDDELFNLSNDDAGDNENSMNEHLKECLECALGVALYLASFELEAAEDGSDFPNDEPATDEELQEMAAERWPYLAWARGAGFVYKS